MEFKNIVISAIATGIISGAGTFLSIYNPSTSVKVALVSSGLVALVQGSRYLYNKLNPENPLMVTATKKKYGVEWFVFEREIK